MSYSNTTLYNGTSYAPSLPEERTLLASASHTTTQTTADQDNAGGRGLLVTLDLTVNAGTLGSVTLAIQGKDPASGKYVQILAGVAVTAVSTVQYRIYPGLTAAANSVASDVLPKTWRVVVTANNVNPVTYSVGAVILP